MIYRFTRWLEETTDEIKYKFQRLTRGYSDDEVWNLDYSLCKWLLPRLKKLNETRHGFFNGKSQKETNKIFKDMISALEFFCSEGNSPWLTGKKHQRDYVKHLKGLELIGKHWQSLWD